MPRNATLHRPAKPSDAERLAFQTRLPIAGIQLREGGCPDNLVEIVTFDEEGKAKLFSCMMAFSFVSISVVHGCHLLKDDKQKNSTERFITYKPQECTWDSKLILPKAPWSIKSASFTRHRRRRDVYSAFMDRVEEKFTQTCRNRFSGILENCQ
ncbi:putative uncharacterized protein C7orf78 homolog [Callorhinus ursinus]|uniref:putative uncharacterized protein C7orf78 homolog n=1 Tax=Callorhinus ursinus TaxID=34884 RepID=UPI003CD04B37